MNRREFLVVLSSAAAVAASSSAGWAEDVGGGEYDVIDVGSLDQFEQDKVYDDHREQGFFIIRRGDEVFALSSVCTHKGCKVRSQDDQSFLCKCHKSRFDPEGKVLNGPATRDLPRLSVKRSAQDHILVRLRKTN
jgi:Rieske Fe-S protein